MKFLVSSLVLCAAWFATATSSFAQEAESATPALVTITLPHHDEKATGSIPMEEGLLREGLDQSSHPQAAPILVIKPAANPPVPRARRTSDQPRARVQRSASQQLVARPAKTRPPVVSRAVRPRSPVVSFIYWWNGWVIRTFHTKIGTVRLGTVGAKL